jgi:mono/diheme cytochrome c family protein
VPARLPTQSLVAMAAIRTTPRTALARVAALACLWMTASPLAAEDHPGLAIYREHCGRCHGENGVGTKDVPEQLVGDRSVNQLAAYIHDTMPEDDPSKVTGDAARQVAEYIHGSFYSAVARDRNRPARVELSRLTVRQYQNTAADLIASFRNRGPGIDGRRGLRAEYFRNRDFNRQTGLVYEQIDPQVDFDFGVEGPDPERFEPNRFAIRWNGSLVPPETGVYEFVIRTAHSAKLALNTAWYEPPLIDAYVKSGNDTEYKANILLLGGRAYPLRLEFSKANQGVDKKENEYPTHASMQLLWRPPHGVLEPVPERCLIPHDAAEVFVVKTPFPPDDKSIGYERGSSVSKEWFAAATAASVEMADYTLEHIEHLAHTKRDSADRAEKLRQFATTFATRAFRRPLTDALRALFVDRPFTDAPDLDTALKRSLLLVLQSPRFLVHTEAAANGTPDGFATAARLSFGLWDSIPDQPLWEAASRNQLATVEQVRKQAERMVNDRRTRAKVHDFMFAWLRIEHGPEIVKDKTQYSEFSPEIAADLRTSLELLVDDAIWGREPHGGDSDFRRLFTDDEVYLNGRLGPLYGMTLPAEASFRRVRLDEGRRAGVLSHPYMASVLSYSAATSPIHRGVFLARSVLGNVLKPPMEAIAPLAPDLHPDLSTRERVALQTSSVACQTCHTMINPLGFALEEFDPIGRYRTTEKRGDVQKPIDASGSYLPREGPQATFRGARELAAAIAGSRDAQEAFVQQLFHALAKQPARAWGPDTLETLRQGFAANTFDVRRLLVDIMTVAALSPPPPAPPQTTATPSPAPEKAP